MGHCWLPGCNMRAGPTGLVPHTHIAIDDVMVGRLSVVCVFHQVARLCCDRARRT